MLLVVDDEDVMLSGDIAARLGVTRERARQLSHRADFPAPTKTIGTLRAWRSADVEAWIAEHRPDLGPAAPIPSASERARLSIRRRWSLGELHQELDRYEQALSAAGVALRTTTADVERPRRFLRWLAGEYNPADSVTTVRPAPRDSADPPATEDAE